MATLSDYKKYFKNTWLLTPREIEVTTLLILGRTNKEIAESIGVSTETVNKHLDRVYRKAGVKGRVKLFSRLLLNATV